MPRAGEQLLKQLGRYRRRWWLRDLLAAWSAMVLGAGLPLAGLVLADAHWSLSSGQRVVLGAAWLLAGVVWTVGVLGRLLRRRRDVRAVAERIERGEPGWSGRLIAAVELLRTADAANDPWIARAAEQIEGRWTSSAAASPIRWRASACMAAGSLLLLSASVGVWVSRPAWGGAVLARWTEPYADPDRPAWSRITRVRPIYYVARGESAHLWGIVEGRSSGQIIMEARAGSQPAATQHAPIDGRGRFQFSLLSVVEPVDVVIRAERAGPVASRVVPVDRPRIERIEAEVSSPRWCALPTRQATGSTVRALPGSTIQWRITLDRPAYAVQRVDSGDSPTTYTHLRSMDGRTWTWTGLAEENAAWSLRIIDRQRVRADVPETLRLELLSDEPARLTLRAPPADHVVAQGGSLTIDADWQDDLGVEQIELVWRDAAAADSTAEQRWTLWQGEPAPEGTCHQGWGIQHGPWLAGQTVICWLEARELHAPQQPRPAVRSRAATVRVLTPEGARQALMAELAGVFDAMAELATLQAEAWTGTRQAMDLLMPYAAAVESGEQIHHGGTEARSGESRMENGEWRKGEADRLDPATRPSALTQRSILNAPIQSLPPRVVSAFVALDLAARQTQVSTGTDALLEHLDAVALRWWELPWAYQEEARQLVEWDTQIRIVVGEPSDRVASDLRRIESGTLAAGLDVLKRADVQQQQILRQLAAWAAQRPADHRQASTDGQPGNDLDWSRLSRAAQADELHEPDDSDRGILAERMETKPDSDEPDQSKSDIAGPGLQEPGRGSAGGVRGTAGRVGATTGQWEPVDTSAVTGGETWRPAVPADAQERLQQHAGDPMPADYAEQIRGYYDALGGERSISQPSE